MVQTNKVTEPPDKHIRVSPATHKRIRLHAAAVGKSLRDVVEAAIKLYLTPAGKVAK